MKYLLLLTLAACGTPDVTKDPIVTNFGSRVSFREDVQDIYTAEDINTMQGDVLLKLSIKGQDMSKMMKATADWQAEFVPTNFSAPGMPSNMGGMTDGDFSLVAMKTNCHDTSFRHEMVHYLQGRLTGVNDVDHKDPKFWWNLLVWKD